MVGIYKITNIVNKKVYIGKSLLIQYRWKKHLWNLKKNNHINKHLQAAYNKYSNINFTFDIIEYCNKENVYEREKFYINKFKASNPEFGYNKTKGGDGLLATKEIKTKISNSLKGIKHTKEKKLNQSKAQLGKKRSISHKEAISKSLLKSVMQYDLDGNFIKEWNSIQQINNILGFDSSCISRCCNNKQKTSMNCIWKFK